MEKVRLHARVMDVDNAGVEWGSPVQVEIEAPDDSLAGDEREREIARRVNRAHALAVGAAEPDEEAPGEVIRAAGDEYHGIAWIDDVGHQGATRLILEWHQA